MKTGTGFPDQRYHPPLVAFRKSAPPVVGALALLLLVAVAGVPLLALLPAVLLIGFLSLGPEKGEAVLGRLCSRYERRRARSPRSLDPPRARFTFLVPRGSELLASGRAVRPPPPQLLPI